MFSRRRVLIGGGVVAVGAFLGGIFAEPVVSGVLPTATPTPTATPAVKTVMRTFVSTKLTTPKISVIKRGRTAPGLLFVEPSVENFHGLIMRQSGEPVWIEPTGVTLTDLRVQTYLGKPVLTYWTGKSTGGHGLGKGVILDTSYRPVATVSAGNGLEADLHEFNLTANGTALITAYPVVKADLTALGGPAAGYIYNCHVQEIDVATGAVLLDWSAMDHVDVSETYLKLASGTGKTASTAFDPYHLNAVDADGDALLVSARHTHTVYRIDRSTGEVRWRFGGRKSDITVAPAAAFAWQHDVRRQADGTITMFDNHLYTGQTNGASRGLKFVVDETALTSTLQQAYAYDGHLGTAMGSTQVLPGGNVLVGWGTDPSFTEFTADGQMVYEADNLGSGCYRVNKSAWTATPVTVPDVAAKSGSGGAMTVYASWNGATNVASWNILTGTSAASLAKVTTIAGAGFESSASVAAAAMVAVQALDGDGKVLSTSAVTSV